MDQLDITSMLNVSKTLRILYVEDNKEARTQTLKMLSNLFEHISVAEDGVQGLEKFRNKTFDLVITDINMPKLNGLEMLRYIREQNEDVSTIIISAHDETNHFTQSIDLGVDGYLLKPLNLEHFVKLMRKIIQKNQQKEEKEAYKKALELLNHDLEQKVIQRTQELENKLLIDDLTGISNRYAFLQELAKHPGEVPTIFLLNIDTFTIYNELYGIEIGNEILIEFAKILQTYANNKGYKLFRISGDEFVLFEASNFADTTKSEQTLHQLLNLVKTTPLYIRSIDDYIFLSVTIGISFSKENPLGKADMAMKAAKKSAKKFMTYNYQIDNQADLQKTLYWKKEIEAALREDRVIPYFQPIVDREQNIVKYEALMRIKQYNQQGEEKIIPPFEFLEIALKTKQYNELSYRLISKAIEEIANKHYSLSININQNDIYNYELVSMLKKRIRLFYKQNDPKDTDAPKIILEILEDDNIQHYTSLQQELEQFRILGAKIAIDDFGSGYSNFSHIIGISPGYLKIDAYLIKNIHKDKRSYEIVKAIVQFAKSLHIRTIAEFVANEEIFTIAHDLGIDEFQGYYFGKPIPSQEIMPALISA